MENVYRCASAGSVDIIKPPDGNNISRSRHWCYIQGGSDRPPYPQSEVIKLGDIIRCPFYVNHKSRTGNVTLTCENIKNKMGFEMQNMLRFKNLEERKDWMELFCKEKYENCPYYTAIYQKYEEDQHGNCK